MNIKTDRLGFSDNYIKSDKGTDKIVSGKAPEEKSNCASSSKIDENKLNNNDKQASYRRAKLVHRVVERTCDDAKRKLNRIEIKAGALFNRMWQADGADFDAAMDAWVDMVARRASTFAAACELRESENALKIVTNTLNNAKALLDQSKNL